LSSSYWCQDRKITHRDESAHLAFGDCRTEHIGTFLIGIRKSEVQMRYFLILNHSVKNKKINLTFSQGSG